MKTLTDREGKVYQCPNLTQDVKWPYINDADLSNSTLHRVNLSGSLLRRVIFTNSKLENANLELGEFYSCDFSGAYLKHSNLQRADLANCILNDVDLRGSNLLKVDLTGADLTGAKMPEHPLNILRASPGIIYAYKFVNANRRSPMVSMFSRYLYEVGRTINEPVFCSDERIECAAGLHVATKEWILRNKDADSIVYLVKFKAKNIVAIPYCSDGKFRVNKLTVVKEVKLD